MDDTEKRMNARAQYFLIKDEKEAVPIYAFRDPADELAIPALVVDLGEGGVQILSSRSADLSHETFTLALVVTGDAADAALGQKVVQRVWSRDDGTNLRTGFAFAQDADAGAEWVKVLEDAPHRLLRCVLHPVPRSST